MQYKFYNKADENINDFAIRVVAIAKSENRRIIAIFNDVELMVETDSTNRELIYFYRLTLLRKKYNDYNYNDGNRY